MKEYKILVCGGRNFQNKNLLFKALSSLPFAVSCVINGGAKGADSLSTQWAIYEDIPYKEYPPDWKKYGKAAGPIRNSEMLQLEDIEYVVAFPGGKGTQDMIRKAKAAGILVIKVRPK